MDAVPGRAPSNRAPPKSQRLPKPSESPESRHLVVRRQKSAAALSIRAREAVASLRHHHRCLRRGCKPGRGALRARHPGAQPHPRLRFRAHRCSARFTTTDNRAARIAFCGRAPNPIRSSYVLNGKTRPTSRRLHLFRGKPPRLYRLHERRVVGFGLVGVELRELGERSIHPAG